ncbi:type II toxin-antitoxin system RelE/ParE family toxin [Paenibacillus aurantius]|uniref:Type II toxin-antitoxin system RelE/ParE family toxin n=1 Tax=Paenibacillus aurantius TaxID=2918900 RepID=A0AA96LF81_9BACL|nr:type II toxin-antitoxin system RelE/ParE family toxin [Paenibacillus aurantius]WNQ11943.1 type II toxin-antitoxin system RelE/ParE family toxin [Paenibacillus aurantius]
MNYEVKFYKDAIKTLQKLDRVTRNRILDPINILSENPNHPELDIKKMQGVPDQFRLRIGSYRVVFSVFNDQLIVVVIRIGSRGDVYKP